MFLPLPPRSWQGRQRNLLPRPGIVLNPLRWASLTREHGQ